MAVQKFRKKPVEIEACVWTGANTDEIQKFCPSAQITTNTTTAAKAACGKLKWVSTHDLVIPTLEGNHHASIGDFIIKGVNGEFYPCKPDIFWKTYEVAEDNKEDNDADC